MQRDRDTEVGRNRNRERVRETGRRKDRDVESGRETVFIEKKQARYSFEPFVHSFREKHVP